MLNGNISKLAKSRHGLSLLSRSSINKDELFSIFGRRYADTPESSDKPGRGDSRSGKPPGETLARFASAQEEAYFHLKQREELARIKKELKENPELMLKKKKDKESEPQ